MSDATQSGYIECPACRGAGRSDRSLYCGGTGKVENNAYLELPSLNGTPPGTRANHPFMVRKTA